MKEKKWLLTDFLRMAVVLVAVFLLNLGLQTMFNTRTLIPMIFVLGVFLVSWWTRGYFWGITASLISVLAVNYAFTYPYWAFDLITPECVSSAAVMLIVATMTGTLTTKLKAQEKMKAEAEKERMRGNLLRAVSHDLRTPLTAIYGACSTMIEHYDELPGEKKLRLLSEMRADAQWLVRMVENLLSITRIDDQKVRLNKNDTVLEELIDSVLVKFRKHYPAQAVQVEIPEEFVSIPMDAMLIEQVLMNLLENAVFHAAGMQNLWLKVTLRGNYVMFTVEDDGCGIPGDRMKRIFSGNLDGEHLRESGRSNMGIGLSVCNAIIRAHGATLCAENRPGGGARFSFAMEREDTENGQQ